VKTWNVILATLVIFGAGVITGALVVNLGRKVEARALPAAPRANPAVPPLAFANIQKSEYLRRLDKQLGLTQEQYETLEEILIESNERTKKLWQPIAPQMIEEIKHVREKIRAELSPDQQKKFDQPPPKARPARKPDAPGNRPAKPSSRDTTTNPPSAPGKLAESLATYQFTQ